jgi:putative addiction module CopG family antidote
MKTYQITLPDEFAAFVDRMIAEGKWESADYLVMAGLSMVESGLTLEDSFDKEWLKKEIQKGIDSANRGELAPLDMAAIWARVERRLAEE